MTRPIPKPHSCSFVIDFGNWGIIQNIVIPLGKQFWPSFKFWQANVRLNIGSLQYGKEENSVSELFSELSTFSVLHWTDFLFHIFMSCHVNYNYDDLFSEDNSKILEISNRLSVQNRKMQALISAPADPPQGWSLYSQLYYKYFCCIDFRIW